MSSLAGCSALGGSEHPKPVDRASVIQEFESSVEDDGLEVIQTFSDWYGDEARDYRVWYVTEGDSSKPTTSEMEVIGKAFAESIPSHDYARALRVSSWPSAEQKGDRWDYYIKNEWALEWVNQDIGEETFIERIENTLSQQGTP